MTITHNGHFIYLLLFFLPCAPWRSKAHPHVPDVTFILTALQTCLCLGVLPLAGAGWRCSFRLRAPVWLGNKLQEVGGRLSEQSRLLHSDELPFGVRLRRCREVGSVGRGGAGRDEAEPRGPDSSLSSAVAWRRTQGGQWSKTPSQPSAGCDDAASLCTSCSHAGMLEIVMFLCLGSHRSGSLIIIIMMMINK